jgi:hypothetical protein
MKKITKILDPWPTHSLKLLTFGPSDVQPTRCAVKVSSGGVDEKLNGFRQLLTGNVPYSYRRHDWLVIQDIMRGSKPARPEDGLFSGIQDEIWGLLDHCWSVSAWDRPGMAELELSLRRTRGLGCKL